MNAHVRFPPTLAGSFSALLLAAALAACTSGPESVPYSGLIAASEFVVGENRFPFGLVSREGEFLEGADVTVRFYSLREDDPLLLTEEPAVWRTVEGVTPHLHDDGSTHQHLDLQGVYVVDSVMIPHEGIWGAEFVVRGEYAGGISLEGAAFQVAATATVPAVGDRVPATANLTIHDVDSFAELSTRSVEDDMHNVSVASALEIGEPFVVFFASPQFCVSAMCGPVTDTMDQAQREAGPGVEFIHIEPWDLSAAREEGRLVPAPVMLEWRLPTEPWTFVVDADGRVAMRFEGLVTVEEVLAALASQG